MRIFLAGDYRTGTGPANVTKQYLNRLPKNTLYLKAQSKLLRIPEIIMKTICADVVLYSGYSRQNLLGLKLARILRRPSAYLMHGCVEHENAINGVMDTTMNHVERRTMELANRIYAVSEWFANWLKLEYPEYLDKIDSAVNGIDFSLCKDNRMNLKLDNAGYRKHEQIVTIGGGMPRKRIRYICDAIQQLNGNNPERALSLVVVGARGLDTEVINNYSFVENRGLVSSKEVEGLLNSSMLFVQNSCFETFGLAPVEALMCGCSILSSQHVGALELFHHLEDGDIICDCEDPTEIAAKIDGLLHKGNAERLMNEIDKESTSWEARTNQLMDKLLLLIQK